MPYVVSLASTVESRAIKIEGMPLRYSLRFLEAAEIRVLDRASENVIISSEDLSYCYVEFATFFFRLEAINSRKVSLYRLMVQEKLWGGHSAKIVSTGPDFKKFNREQKFVNINEVLLWRQFRCCLVADKNTKLIDPLAAVPFNVINDSVAPFL